MGKGKKGVRKGRGAGSGPGPSSSNNKGEERAARKAAKKQRQKGKRFGDKEEREYEAQLAAIGGTIQHMASDGNCLFRSIYDQLEGAWWRGTSRAHTEPSIRFDPPRRISTSTIHHFPPQASPRSTWSAGCGW